jgi:hypothetical protein
MVVIAHLPSGKEREAGFQRFVHDLKLAAR